VKWQGKTNFKNPQHNYTKALIFAPFSRFLKRLPTIQDFLEDSINTEVVTQEDRTFHNKLYSRDILEVINVEKEYFSCGFFGKIRI
jgi:peptide/nickel transport system ATP-binding protein